MKSNRVVLPSLFALFGAASVACGPQDSTGVGNPGLTKEEQALVTDGNDSNAAGDTASSIIAIPMLGILSKDHVATQDVAAGRGVLGVMGYPVFSTCVDTARAANVVTYTFNGCTGPFGFIALRGTLTATYTVVTAGSVEIDVTGTGLTLNKTPFEETGHATLTFLGDGTKQVVWSGEFKGTTPRGRPVKHTAAYTIGVSTAPDSATCVALDGGATTTVDLGDPTAEHGVTTTISGYQRCGARTVCPTTGTVDVVNLTPAPKVHDVHVVFLGGASAQVTVTRPEGKKTFTVPLVCD